EEQNRRPARRTALLEGNVEHARVYVPEHGPKRIIELLSRGSDGSPLHRRTGGRFARARQNGPMLGGGSAYVNRRVAWPQPAGGSPSLTAVITWMRSSGVGLATP